MTSWEILAFFIGLVTLPGTLEIAALTIAGIFPTKKCLPSEPHHFVVLIPAHNEEGLIKRTLESLKQCVKASDCIVIADNCTDRTVYFAREMGAQVIIRNDPEKKGKHHALAEAFQILDKEAYEYFYIIDADTEVSLNFFNQTFALLKNGADAVQAYYGVLNKDQSIRTRLAYIALLAFNRLRPRGRNALGFSSGILGNGFALPKKTLRDVPFHADSIAEDISYHLQLIKHGKKVIFNDHTQVLSEMPLSFKGFATQHTRWEGGRLQLLRQKTPLLFKEVLGGNWLAFEPLLDLLTLPLSFHTFLLLLLLPFSTTRCYAIIALCVVFLHLIAALIIGKASWKDYAVLLFSPLYLLWKIALTPLIALSSKKKAAWKRTERNP